MMGDVHSMDEVNGHERAREEWHWVVFVEVPLVLRSLGWGKGRGKAYLGCWFQLLRGFVQRIE